MILRRSRLLTLLIAAAVLLAVTGLVLVGVYFVLRNRPEQPVQLIQDPWAPEAVSIVSPPVALRTLAGEMPEVTVQAALTIDDLDTAYSVLVHSPALSDPERIGHLLLLARRYADVGQTPMMSACLHQVQLIITLSPLLSDVSRADAALQSASIWTSLGLSDNAAISLAQTAVIAEHSVRLRPAQIEALWLRLADAYEARGDQEEAVSARQSAARSGPRTTNSAAEPLLIGFGGEAPDSPEIRDAQAGRQQRAIRLIEQLLAGEEVDVGPEVADLAEFLRREDASRTVHYDLAAASAPELSAQAAIARSRTRWLTLKYGIASRVYGLSLVPEWEEDRALIRSELNKAYEELFRLYGDQAMALPVATDVDRARIEVLQQEILLGELQLYPDFPEDRLVQQLQEAQQRSAAGSSASLRVSIQAEDGKHVFSLQGGMAP